MENNKEPLLPCPFCGGEATIEQNKPNGYKLKCTSCLMGISQKVLRNSMEWLKETMIKDWNKRTYTPPVAPEAAPVKSAEEILYEHTGGVHPNHKDQVLAAMEEYKNQFHPVAGSIPVGGEKNKHKAK